MTVAYACQCLYVCMVAMEIDLCGQIHILARTMNEHFGT